MEGRVFGPGRNAGFENPALHCVQRNNKMTRDSSLRTSALCLLPFAFVVALSAQQRASSVPARPDAATIAHVLNRIGYGPRAGDMARVQRIGLAAYIDQQLAPERIADDALDLRLTALATVGLSASEVAQKYFMPAQTAQQQGRDFRTEQMTMQGEAAYVKPPPPPEQVRMAQQQQQSVLGDLTQQRILRAAMSEKQLEEVLVDFWFNHFNVFVGKGQPEQIYLAEYERDVIRAHVLGSFRELLGATAHSPAMLFYLDNFQSVDPHAPERALAEQAAALEMQPNTTEVQRLQMQLRIAQQREQMLRQQPRGLNENYGRELMELHTLGVDGGYTQQDVINVARAFTGWTIDRPQQGGGFKFDDRVHDTTEKTILGVVFPAGHGEEEGERVLDLLANHPSTAHHIAYQLAQRFVADEPPKALVDRAAKKFLETKGDLREVTRLIITSPEFFAPAAVNAKVKTPFDFVISAVRASGAAIENAQPLVQGLRTLGMPLYGCVPPTGYSDARGEWLNTGALLARMNMALQLAANQIRGVRVDVSAAQPATDTDRQRIIDAVLAGTASPPTRESMATSLNQQTILALALSSPEFQRR
jgi:uncharacterized protein (DUF1800 family)